MNSIPHQLDKYTLITCLGRGATAEVWQASDTHLQRFVAIKILHPNLRDDPTFLERFRREAQLIASLHHPNIVPVHDYQVLQPVASTLDSNPNMHSIPYIVMDYIEGSTLAHYLGSTPNKRNLLSPTEIVNLFLSLSSPIDYAHREHMIHRDIKPANILLDQRNTRRNPMGEPILTDFGVAKLLDTVSITQTGMQLSTPAYISPEQVQGYPATERSDLYALAVILYEVVTGVVPFQGNSPLEVMTQHSMLAPMLPSQINPHVPPALDQVILCGLEKDPARRFSSAAALTVALAQALGVTVPDMPVIVCPASLSSSPMYPPQQISGQSPLSQPQFTVANTNFPELSSRPANQLGENTPLTPGLISPLQIPSSLGAFSVPPAHPDQPIFAARGKMWPHNRLISLIALALVICIIAGLAIVFLPRVLTPSSALVGQAFFTSSGQITPGTARGIADQMQIDLQNVPAPQAGKRYSVWLLADKVVIGGHDLTGPAPIQPPLLLTKNLPVNNGHVHYFFPGDGQANNLLSETSRLLITEDDANQTLRAPSTDRATWRYFAMIPQQPIPNDPTQLNAVNHIRHLFYNESRAQVLGLPGGLDFWLSRNTEKVLELSVTARDDWYGAQTTPAQVALMTPLFIRILDYLDGTGNIHDDVSNAPIINITDTTDAKIALLTIDPRQKVDLAADPLGYVDHTALHVQQVVRAPDSTPDMRLHASNIYNALQNAGRWLAQVHKDAIALYTMSNGDPAQWQQPQAGQLLDDLVTQATYATIGQLDSVSNQVHPGVTQAHYEMQKLAMLAITTDMPSSL